MDHWILVYFLYSRTAKYCNISFPQNCASLEANQNASSFCTNGSETFKCNGSLTLDYSLYPLFKAILEPSSWKLRFPQPLSLCCDWLRRSLRSLNRSLHSLISELCPLETHRQQWMFIAAIITGRLAALVEHPVELSHDFPTLPPCVLLSAGLRVQSTVDGLCQKVKTHRQRWMLTEDTRKCLLCVFWTKGAFLVAQC